MITQIRDYINTAIAATPSLHSYLAAKRVLIGLPKPEEGVPQITIDTWFSVTPDAKLGYSEELRVYISLWHRTDQKAILEADTQSRVLAGLLHRASQDGIHLYVIGREPLPDTDSNMNRIRVQLAAVS